MEELWSLCSSLKTYAWFTMILVYGMAKHSMAWHGMTYHDMEWHGMASYEIAWHGMAWHT